MSRLEGVFGWAERAEDPTHPNAAVTVAQRLMYLPGQGLGYNHFVLSVIDLADVPGVPPPVLRYPGAQFELLVGGLDPDLCPDAGNVETLSVMSPPNFVDQFHGVTRGQAEQICEQLVRACLAGRLVAETQVYTQMYDGSPARMMTVKVLVERVEGHPGEVGRAPPHRWAPRAGQLKRRTARTPIWCGRFVVPRRGEPVTGEGLRGGVRQRRTGFPRRTGRCT